MTYSTILTTKGTTTIPQEIRNELGVKPGMRIEFYQGNDGEFIIKRAQTLDEIRKLNTKALKTAGTQDKIYKSGDGFNLSIIKQQNTQHG